MRRLQLRHHDNDSIVHRLRPETKIGCLLAASTAVAFNPGWPVLGGGWLVAVLVFLLARLPFGVLAPPPPLFFYVTMFGGLFSLFSGGDPEVAGVALGGVLEFAQLVTVGLLLVTYAALLAWTTSLAEVGMGLSRMLRPLRHVGFPVEEVTTVLALAVRSLPLVAKEIQLAADARRTRPEEAVKVRGGAAPLVEAVDFGAMVVVGTQRRARELARAMVVRGSLVAPDPEHRPWRWADPLALVIAATGAVAVFLIA